MPDVKPARKKGRSLQPWRDTIAIKRKPAASRRYKPIASVHGHFYTVPTAAPAAAQGQRFKPMKPRARVSDSIQDPVLRATVRDMLPDADAWLMTEDFQLGGYKPITLIREGKGKQIYHLLLAIKHGAFS